MLRLYMKDYRKLHKCKGSEEVVLTQIMTPIGIVKTNFELLHLCRLLFFLFLFKEKFLPKIQFWKEYLKKNYIKCAGYLAFTYTYIFAIQN